MLFTGFANINLWYPWSFNFRTSHYWVAWITIGSLVVHIGAKFTITRNALTRRPAKVRTSRSPSPFGRDRRVFLGLVAGASGLLTSSPSVKQCGRCASSRCSRPGVPTPVPRAFR